MTIELYAINRKLAAFFGRYHMVAFILLACLLLAVAVYMLFAVIESSNADSTSTNSTIPNFDQKTIDKIKNLRDSNSGSAQLQLPSPRSNPFSE